jgi:D-serine deaminase-like pyridoxal phosphate-dependent protein
MSATQCHPEVLALIARHSERLGWRIEHPAVGEALDLVGRAGSRWMIPTPAAIVLIGDLVANIDVMQARISAAGLSVRPHTKTHKSAAIAELQLHAGAVGVCCAKLGEAEALSRAGIGSILVTSPLVPLLARRLATLLEAAPSSAVVVDHRDGVIAAAEAAGRSGVPLSVFIDIDVGLGRTGATDAAHAVALAGQVVDSPRLVFAGVQGYGGHWQHVPGRTARSEQVSVGMARLRMAIEAIEASVGPVRTVTGGGTGTVGADCEIGVLNELQPGSYVFMDGQYQAALGDDIEGSFATALTIATTVISANQDGWVTVDGGLKAFATDAAPPTPYGVDGEYHFYGDEHGMLLSQPTQRAGNRIEFVSPHCDPTVDRYDVLHIVDGDDLIGIVPVDARGCSA